MTDQEINEAVARKLGWEINTTMRQAVKGDEGKKIFLPDQIPHYCTNIEAAWEVVEHVKGFVFVLSCNDKAWTAQWITQNSAASPRYLAEADTAQMAICVAFLKLP